MRSEILRYLSRSPVPITPKKMATSQLSGEWPSSKVGKGFDFRNHRKYELGDDPRSVHMAMTVRTGDKMVVDRIAMRDISVLVVLDCSASMGVRHKADMLLATALMLLYSGVSMEMRVGAALAGVDGYYHMGKGTGMRHAMRLFTGIEDVCESLRHGKSVKPELPRKDAHRLLPVSGILLYLSDFLDGKGFMQEYSNFSIESRRYDFIPVVIQDEFEYSFPDIPDQTQIEFSNPETGYTEPVWLGQREKDIFRSAHEKRFSDLKTMFSSHGLRFVHIMSPVIEHIHMSLTRYFTLR